MATDADTLSVPHGKKKFCRWKMHFYLLNVRVLKLVVSYWLGCPLWLCSEIYVCCQYCLGYHGDHFQLDMDGDWHLCLSAEYYAVNRGPYMSSHVLLNLLNELGKRDKMRGLPSILSLFRNEFNKFNNTGAWMVDSIYHMILKLFWIHIFGV